MSFPGWQALLPETFSVNDAKAHSWPPRARTQKFTSFTQSRLARSAQFHTSTLSCINEGCLLGTDQVVYAECLKCGVSRTKLRRYQNCPGTGCPLQSLLPRTVTGNSVSTYRGHGVLRYLVEHYFCMFP